MNTFATDGRRNLRWLMVPAYLTLFVLLDWASYIRPFEGMNITPWNPQPALAIALLLAEPRRLWLVWLGLLAAELTVRGIPAALKFAAVGRLRQIGPARSSPPARSPWLTARWHAPCR